MTKRDYKTSATSEYLKSEGTSVKAFADWLGRDIASVSRELRRADEKGVGKELECCIKCFVFEKKGFILKIKGLF